MRLAGQKMRPPKLPKPGPGPTRPQQKGLRAFSEMRVPSWVFPRLPLCDASFPFRTLSSVTPVHSRDGAEVGCKATVPSRSGGQGGGRGPRVFSVNGTPGLCMQDPLAFWYALFFFLAAPGLDYSVWKDSRRLSRGAAGNPRVPRLLPGTLGNLPGCL